MLGGVSHGIIGALYKSHGGYSRDKLIAKRIRQRTVKVNRHRDKVINKLRSQNYTFKEIGEMMNMKPENCRQAHYNNGGEKIGNVSSLDLKDKELSRVAYRLIQDQYKYREVAEMLGISPSRVSHIIKRHLKVAPGSIMREARNKKVIEMAEKGMLAHEIAKEFRMTPANVGIILKDNGYVLVQYYKKTPSRLTS